MRNIIEQLFDDRKKHTQHPILDHSVHEHQLVFQKLIDLRNRMTDKMESDPTSVVHYQLDKGYKKKFEDGDITDKCFEGDIDRTSMIEQPNYPDEEINFPELATFNDNESDLGFKALKNHHGCSQNQAIGKILESRNILCQVTDSCSFIIKDMEANYHTFSVSISSKPDNVIELQHMEFTRDGKIEGNKYIINSRTFPELQIDGPMYLHPAVTNNTAITPEKEAVIIFELDIALQKRKFQLIYPNIGYPTDPGLTKEKWLDWFYTKDRWVQVKKRILKIRIIGITSFLILGVLIGILYSPLHHEYIWLATAAFTILAPILISVYMLKNLTNKSCGAKIFGLGLIGIISIAAILIPDLFLSFEIAIYKYLPNIILPTIMVLGIILLGLLFIRTNNNILSVPPRHTKDQVISYALYHLKNTTNNQEYLLRKHQMVCMASSKKTYDPKLLDKIIALYR